MVLLAGTGAADGSGPLARSHAGSTPNVPVLLQAFASVSFLLPFPIAAAHQPSPWRRETGGKALVRDLAEDAFVDFSPLFSWAVSEGGGATFTNGGRGSLAALRPGCRCPTALAHFPACPRGRGDGSGSVMGTGTSTSFSADRTCTSCGRSLGVMVYPQAPVLTLNWSMF